MSSEAGFCLGKGGDACQESEIRAVKTIQNNKDGVWRRKMNKRIFALVAVLTLVGLLVPVAVFSAESTVTCTVSAVLVSVSVDDGSVAYGTLALGATKNTAKYDGSNNPNGMATPQTQTITNTGTVQEDFRVKTSNAIGTTAWTLGETAGSDIFTHAWNWGSTQYDGSGSITFTQWTTADTYLVSGVDVPAEGGRYLELQIGMPNPVTDYGSHTITVTVEALEG